MNSIEDFPWNENCVDVIKAYTYDNYVVEDMNNHTGRVILFCSGNGLYYPDTESEFNKRILQDNYYEWWRIGHLKQIKKHFQRVIYIRDIYKQWYVKGINKECDSIDKLHEKLAELCNGFRITIVGVSAGGYIASVLGMLLGAERVINISGQWILETNSNLGPYIEIYSDDINRNKYYDVPSLMDREKMDGSSIFYFWPCKSEQDVYQHDRIVGTNANSIPVDCHVHGSLFRKETFPYLFTCNISRLKRICGEHGENGYSDNDIFVTVVPLCKVIYYKMKHVLGRLIGKRE